jgi:putative transposase
MNSIFHVLSRGVDKRRIFMDNQDYYRFIHDLFEFNNEIPANMASENFYKNYLDIARPSKIKPRKLLVKILAFCLMPNHYHLLLQPMKENSVSLFMKKLNMGYAKYFNRKHKRTGALFEGRYKSVEVKDEAHFIHLPYYIHLNPLDLVVKNWRERKISKQDYKKAISFLDEYRWSSHLDYCGEKNFPSVTQRNFLLDFFGGGMKYKKSIERWLLEMAPEKDSPKKFFLD